MTNRMSHLQWGKSPISQVNGKKKTCLLFSTGEAYHLRREETDWFDKPRDGRLDSGQERRQVRPDSSVHARPASDVASLNPAHA